MKVACSGGQQSRRIGRAAGGGGRLGLQAVAAHRWTTNRRSRLVTLGSTSRSSWWRHLAPGTDEHAESAMVDGGAGPMRRRRGEWRLGRVVVVAGRRGARATGGGGFIGAGHEVALARTPRKGGSGAVRSAWPWPLARWAWRAYGWAGAVLGWAYGLSPKGKDRVYYFSEFIFSAKTIPESLENVLRHEK